MVTTPIRSQEQIYRSSRSQETRTNVLSYLPKSPLFGTDGIRGKAGELLNASFTLQLGISAGKVLREISPLEGPVIVGQDSRNSSDMLASAIAAGLTSAGLEVWNLGLCPTPCVSHLARTTQAIGGIMISASHNPPEDNGIKFFGNDGLKLSGAYTEKIEALLRGTIYPHPAQDTGIWGRNYYRPTLVENYCQALYQSLPSNLNFQGLKIVLDLAWGASVQVAPQVFRALGAEVICLHDQADGDRINVNCGSTHLEVIKQAIQAHQADLGFAFDGDADRVMAVDSKGRVVDGDYILYLWGQHLKAQQKLPDDLIVATVMANLGFERAWAKLGGKMIRTAVGDQHVQAQMWKTGAMLGGEQSGHILCHHHSFSGDGVQTALHLVALVHQTGVSLAELVDQSFRPYPQSLCNVRVEDRERRRNWQQYEKVTQAIAEAEQTMGDQGRILVRASGTEPLIRVMVEAVDPQMVDHWSRKLVKVVETQLQ
jgi:phosphoglucosamine mutase